MTSNKHITGRTNTQESYDGMTWQTWWN